MKTSSTTPEFWIRTRAAEQTLLRIRVPDGWHIVSAKAGRTELKVDGRGTTDVSVQRGAALTR